MSGVASVRPHLTWVTILRWVARIWSVGLVLFWGAFLAEHVSEWLIRPDRWPPAWVVLTVAAHAATVAGLLAGWRWELAGGSVALAGAILFLAGKAQASIAPLLMMVTIAPAAIWLVLGGYERGLRAAESGAG